MEALSKAEYLELLIKKIWSISGKESIFPDLDTGDKIFIVHDGVNETYPGKTGLYFIFKLSDSDISDVPENVITQLQELGWISKWHHKEVVLWKTKRYVRNVMEPILSFFPAKQKHTV